MHTITTSQLLNELGISPEQLAHREIVQFEEANALELVEVGEDGREHFLIGEAAIAWRRLKNAAKLDGENITIVSAFRSISRQAEIIRSKIKEGIDLDKILSVCAPPGYSEHHTGRALDLSTDGVENLTEEFENTTAFKWLEKNAGEFFFSLSYPRENPAGYQFEPWHWCFNSTL
jgi:zinc D-Ala-D-Ala carboxypeptidase